MKNSILILTTLLIGFSSCSVQKRHYMKGFYVSKKNKTESKTNVIVHQPKESEIIEEISLVRQKSETEKQAEPLLASADRVYGELKSSVTNLDDECGDLLTLRNGDEIRVKVIELTSTEIKYKRCDNFDGPLHSVAKNDVFSIKYANGSKEIMSSPSNATGQKSVHWATLTGLGCSFITILLIFVTSLVPVIIIAVLGAAFSFFGYRIAKKYPEKYGANNLILAAVILSGIVLALALLGPLLFLR